ncbi:MAG: DNA-deoxyinosine glycosylase, partial [Erysipelotrichaceae bacterium]|nr:DNA-deoxyinosine glycosylase [Erysipelotrichaceae bacterium]
MRINHELPLLFDDKSKVMILGSFPSVKSREANFYYAHPSNRFWKVMEIIFEEEIT